MKLGKKDPARKVELKAVKAHQKLQKQEAKDWKNRQVAIQQREV